MSKALAVMLAGLVVELTFAQDAGAHGHWWYAASYVFLAVVLVKVHEYFNPVA